MTAGTLKETLEAIQSGNLPLQVASSKFDSPKCEHAVLADSVIGDPEYTLMQIAFKMLFASYINTDTLVCVFQYGVCA